MLSSVAPQVARETDSCEKVQEREGMCMHSPVRGWSARTRTHPLEQFYRNEISNCFSLLLSSSSSFSHARCSIRVFRGNFIIILESFPSNSDNFVSLFVVWKNDILEFFLQRIVSTKNELSTRSICISPRDITFK